VRRSRAISVASAVITLATAIWAGAASGAIQTPTPGEPTTSTGEIRYNATAVAFRHGPQEVRADFFLRIPYREIRFVKADSIYEARLRITIEILKGNTKRVGFQQQQARVQCTDLGATVDSLLGEIYTVGMTVPSGSYRYRVTVEDMNVARRGLVYQMKSKRRQGEVDGTIDLGDWLRREPALSGIEFAWTIRERSEESAFGKGPYEVLPQPSAHFGLCRDSVSFYYEIYGTPPPPEGRIYRIQTTIWGGADTVLSVIDSLRVTEGQAWPHAKTVDIASYPRGHYQLRLEILGERDEPLAATQSPFEVLWSLESWAPEAADYYEVAATTLLSAEEAIRFRSLSRGEKEVLLEDLWRKVDPTPETAENEARKIFQQRLVHANSQFSVFERGMFSDRGRIWIRYGEPDEILAERMPTLDKTLGYQLGDLPQSARETLTKLESGTADIRPYEIWTYQMRGHEIVPRIHMNEVSSGLKFVFVDEQGYGDYILRYSSTASSR
jgi:GWxTD domain-containing protein